MEVKRNYAKFICEGGFDEIPVQNKECQVELIKSINNLFVI